MCCSQLALRPKLVAEASSNVQPFDKFGYLQREWLCAEHAECDADKAFTGGGQHLCLLVHTSAAAGPASSTQPRIR